eukprot:scaffold7675_cov33-Prasinocladus_malaysianus.AAC.1
MKPLYDHSLLVMSRKAQGGSGPGLAEAGLIAGLPAPAAHPARSGRPPERPRETGPARALPAAARRVPQDAAAHVYHSRRADFHSR